MFPVLQWLLQNLEVVLRLRPDQAGAEESGQPHLIVGDRRVVLRFDPQPAPEVLVIILERPDAEQFSDFAIGDVAELPFENHVVQSVFFYRQYQRLIR